MSDKSKDSEIEKEPRQINFPSIMSIKEAACYLTISTYFLYGLVKAGCVPYAKIGKRIVFRQQDLYDWIGQNIKLPEHGIDFEDNEDDFEN